MSPKATWNKYKNAVLTAGAIAGAVVVVAGAINPVLRPVAKTVLVSALDSTYVLQQSYTKDQFADSLTHKQEVDSIFRTMRAIQASQSRGDSSLRCLRRNKPAWCE